MNKEEALETIKSFEGDPNRYADKFIIQSLASHWILILADNNLLPDEISIDKIDSDYGISFFWDREEEEDTVILFCEAEGDSLAGSCWELMNEITSAICNYNKKVL